MITTTTLNAAVDVTYFLPGFPSGGIHRLQKVFREPGGKGNNVAKVLKRLGVPVRATGFIGGTNGEWIRRRFDELGIPHHFIPVEGETRTCLNIVDESTGRQTELLEPGPAVTPGRWEAMKETLAEWAKESRFVIFSGSLPPGLPSDAYQECIRIVQSHGAQAMLDTGGEPLKSGLEARPCTVKPNSRELASIMGRTPRDDEIPSVLRQWNRKGIGLAIITLGERGAWASAEGNVYRITPPSIQAVNPVGSGDAFLAGLAAALYDGTDLDEALRQAAATAASNALHTRAGEISPEQIGALKKEVQVEWVSGSNRGYPECC